MIRGIFLMLMFLFSAVSLYAQDVVFNIEAPRLVAVGEAFRVEFSLNKKPSDFTEPSFEGFEVIAGPSIAQGTSVEISGGKVNKTESYTYTFVLKAVKDGNVTIGAAKTVVGGKEYTTKTIPVEVAKERSNASQNSTNTSTSDQSRPAATTIAKDDILLRMELNRKEVYKGEPIIATVKLYERIPIVNAESWKYPAFNDFWSQRMEVPQQEGTREMLNGKIYTSYVVTKYLLIPQKAGTLDIEQMSADLIVRLITENNGSGNPMFDNFFGGGPSIRDVRKQVSTTPIKVSVKDLPSGAPASFAGAVGRFDFGVNLSSDKISANSSGNMVMTISGMGNLPLINAPKLEFPGSFEHYDVKTTDSYNVTADGFSGSKSFEYPFIARAEGEYTLGPYEFSYFDTQSKTYKTIKTGDFPINILQDVSGSSANNSSIISGVTREDLKIIGKDIHFIRVGEHNLDDKNSFFVNSFGYWLSLLAVVLIFVGIVVYLQKRIKELRDVVKVKNKRANKNALKRLRLAKRYMNEDKEAPFYEEMLKALLGYVSDKLNIPVSDLSKENIKKELANRNATETDVDDLLKIISDCEFARYAPMASVKMSNVYQIALDLIGRFEFKL